MDPSGKTVRDFLNQEFLAPSILTSRLLAKWGLNPQFRPEILGEILFRFVCYRSNLPEELEKFFTKDEFKDVHSKISAYLEKNPDQTIFDRKPISEKEFVSVSQKTLDYFNNRLSGIQEADGLIALWISKHDEALAVPFGLKKKSWGKDEGFYEGGSNPTKLVQWQEELASISSALSPDISRICLGVPLGPFIEKTHGKSLHLPIKLAMEAFFDVLAPSKKDYIATGEISEGGQLVGVLGVEAKSRLANRMGLTFIAQGQGESEDCLLFTPGDSSQNLIEKWKDELGSVQESMTPLESYNKLREYESRIIRRTLPPGKEGVIDSLKFIAQSLENDPVMINEAWRTRVCIGNVLNHEGRAEEALSHFDKALSEVGDSPSELLVSTLANCVVAKVDVGMLAEGEEYGRQAIEKAKELSSSEPANRIRAYLEAAGSLGAQALLAQGLWDEKKKQESRSLLDECVSKSGHLVQIARPHVGFEEEEALNNWAHSNGQLAWWKALYEPEQFLASYEELLDELHQKGEMLAKGQSAFLLRARWHAAFRLALAGKGVGFAWEAWGLEDHDMPFWLKALCFKYRGYLNEKDGSVERAREDFSQSVKLLQDPPDSKPKPNILHVFKGSVLALQYACLDDDSAKSSAVEEFESIRKAGFYYAHPKATPSHWLEFLKGKASRNPQLDFVY